MKHLLLILALALPGCQSPSNTPADNKAIAALQGRGFVLLDGLIARVLPLPQGFRK